MVSLLELFLYYKFHEKCPKVKIQFTLTLLTAHLIFKWTVWPRSLEVKHEHQHTPSISYFQLLLMHHQDSTMGSLGSLRHPGPRVDVQKVECIWPRWPLGGMVSFLANKQNTKVQNYQTDNLLALLKKLTSSLWSRLMPKLS